MHMRTECAKDLFHNKLSALRAHQLARLFRKLSSHFTDIGLDITLYNGIMYSERNLNSD
jgi:hypothetical protein